MGGDCVLASCDCAQAGNFRITLEHLEPHANLVNAVINCFKLGGLVDHVFRGRDLAAIVQPGRYMHRFPVAVIETEILVRAGLLVTGGTCEHLGQLRHPLAVATRVRTLGVDCACDQLDKGFKQFFLRLDEFPGFQRTGCRTRQCLDERDLRTIEGRITQQENTPHQLACTVKQRHGHHVFERRGIWQAVEPQHSSLCGLHYTRARCVVLDGAADHRLATVDRNRLERSRNLQSVMEQCRDRIQRVNIDEIEHPRLRAGRADGFR